MTQTQQAAPEKSTLGLLFGLQQRVPRRTYIIAGFGLMLLKYALDSAGVFLVLGEVYSPLRFLSPILSLRLPTAGGAVMGQGEQTLLIVMALYSLVFMWIGVSMSVRRAVTAGKSPWLGLLFMVPLVNFALILALSILPDDERQADHAGLSLRPAADSHDAQAPVPHKLRSALYGVLAAAAIGGIMLLVSVFSFPSYGAVLFFLTPFTMGAVSAYLYNLKQQQPVDTTILVAMLPIGLTGGGFMLLAFEGVICILMAAPIAIGISLLGALIGRAITQFRRPQLGHPLLVVLALPALAAGEAKLHEPALYEVVSFIEIDARPATVWDNVIGFSELPPPTDIEFQVGIAYPVRARIEGSGVGAIRHCEFSTGAFVEPITRWEKPTRLSFDVTAQPPAMKHWSPFTAVHDRHIGPSIQSKRGEFRLIPLAGGRTRLEGSTWYELEMSPPMYWRMWSDSLIHTIHGRVLNHIRTLSESVDAQTAARLPTGSDTETETSKARFAKLSD